MASLSESIVTLTSGSEGETVSDTEDSEGDFFADDRPPSDEESLVELSSSEESGDADELAGASDLIEPKNGILAVDSQTESTKQNDTIDVKETKTRRKRINLKAGVKTKKKRVRKPASQRRNIRKIINEDKLDMNTVAAQKEEEERKMRLAERVQHLDMPNLKTLLTGKLTEIPAQVPKKPDVIELSSDDECVIIDPYAAVDDADNDPENSGIHVNDSLNLPDAYGRVLVNISHPAADADVFLAPQIGKAVKPHQIGGIRFLYDNVVESLARYPHSQGFGCILAHSMGLGKTIQVVAFTDVFLRYTPAKRVLIIVPINTLQNWVNEFDMWLPEEQVVQGIPPDEILARKFTLSVVNEIHKTVESRAKVIEKWAQEGGALLMGYEMFRLLATRKAKTRKKKAASTPELIDIDREDRVTELQIDMQQALLDPGPDLVICDEGHRIKNTHAGISKSLKMIRTRRRVVLTGYPLQNNLIEYWCMVDFVRPNFLGTRVEFCNMFERPINNGQCADSTPQDVKLMRYRAHVLHSLLQGFVQRRNHKVLQKSLPPKSEWVLLVRMSAFQRRIYNMFMGNLNLDTQSCIGGANPLKAFAVACKIWNHPDVMQKFLDKKTDLDLDIYDGVNTGSAMANGGKKLKKSASDNTLCKNGAEQVDGFNPFAHMAISDRRESEIDYEWVKPAFQDFIPGLLENSGKFTLLMEIVRETLELEEKLLVFSQSLTTLNLVEEYLSRQRVPLPWLNENWCKNQTYCRLDGSTNGSERERLVNLFNAPENKNLCLFLLSTRAGCLGINLIGANRVVMLDASWNPCHDCQAVCRVYRYGQRKPCFIYRLVTDNTMEKKIYDRQVTKQGMSDRVVDEIQVQTQFTKKDTDQLLEYADQDLPCIDPAGIEDKCFDPVLVKVLKKHYKWITQCPFTHESLLIEQEDQKLSKADKRLARESYEREKKFNVSFTRPSYSNFYQNRAPQSLPVFRGPTLPSQSPNVLVRPSIPTPLPHGNSGHLSRLPPIQHIRPGVSVQTIRAHRDIIAPGPEGHVIKKGDTLMVIRTPKGMYIKLVDGKIFAVRNRQDAEGFGISDESMSENPISSILQGYQRPLIPNLHAERRRVAPPTAHEPAVSSSTPFHDSNPLHNDDNSFHPMHGYYNQYMNSAASHYMDTQSQHGLYDPMQWQQYGSPLQLPYPAVASECVSDLFADGVHPPPGANTYMPSQYAHYSQDSFPTTSSQNNQTPPFTDSSSQSANMRPMFSLSASEVDNVG